MPLNWAFLAAQLYFADKKPDDSRTDYSFVTQHSWQKGTPCQTMIALSAPDPAFPAVIEPV